MGWQDRDYAAGPSRGRPAWGGRGGGSPFGGTGVLGGGSIVTKLIAINVVVFVLCSLGGGQRGVSASGLFEFMALHTPYVTHGEVWRLFTAQFLHWSFSHILMNMIGLHFLGRPLERDWGPKRFLWVYMIAGTLGNLFYVALTLFGWLPLEGVAAGASGCVLGLLGAAAVQYPRAQVLVYFLFPVKIRTAALVFGGWYVLNLFTKGNNAGGDACHLAGMLFGAWYAWRGEAWWARSGFSIRLPKFASGTTTRKPVGFQEQVQTRRVDAIEVDRILKKVYDGGVHSLSDVEKRTLQEATDRQKRSGAGRVDRL